MAVALRESHSFLLRFLSMCFRSFALQSDPASHLRNVSYAKLVALNSPYLALGCCNFSLAGMAAKDTRDGLSKEGAGRVAFFKLTGCRHCYTVEVNYHNGRSTNVVQQLPSQPQNLTVNAPPAPPTSSASTSAGKTVAASASIPPSVTASVAAPASAPAAAAAVPAAAEVDLAWQRDDYLMSQESLVGPPVQYAESHFRSMGKALMVALLDLTPSTPATAAAAGSSTPINAAAAAVPSNPYSRLPTSEYVNLAGVDRWSNQYLLHPPKRLARKLSGSKSAAKSASSAAAAPPPAAAKVSAPKASPAASPR